MDLAPFNKVLPKHDTLNARESGEIKPFASRRVCNTRKHHELLRIERLIPTAFFQYRLKADEKFQDTHVALFLMKRGQREWLRIRGRGVHHYYIQTPWKFVQKRRRATVHFLQVQEEMPVNWMKEKPPVPLWLVAVYCVTFFGPLWHTLRGIVRGGDLRWRWHLQASPASVLGNA